MLVVMRFEVSSADAAMAAVFLQEARIALDALSACAGYRSARVARATDDGDRWIVATEWDSVGAYRRALSDFTVKTTAVPLLARAVNEPSAYEVMEARGLGSEGMQIGSGLADEPWPERP